MTREKAAGKSPELAGRALNPGALVHYQEGSVVSRQVVSAGGGNVTLFAFDRGESLSSHTTPFTALAYIIDGEAEITVADKAVVLKQGEMTLLPPDTPHSVSAVTPFKMMLIMMRP
jgi:quercetin dioxygenase-like cupin family protein